MADTYTIINGHQVKLYDLGDGTFSFIPAVQDTQLTGSTLDKAVVTDLLPVLGSAQVSIDTIINAVSVAAGGSTDDVLLGITTEKEAWVYVNIDQQPWTLKGKPPQAVAASAPKTFYPVRSGVTTTYVGDPAVSLFLGQVAGSTYGLTEPTTMTEAKQYLVPPMSNATIRVDNGSAAIATVTVKVLRIWG